MSPRAVRTPTAPRRLKLRLLFFVALGWATILCYESLRETLIYNAKPQQPEPIHDSLFSAEDTGWTQEVTDILQRRTSRCPNISRPQDTEPPLFGKWYTYRRVPSHEIYVYSAFYDNRPEVGVLPYLRLLAVSTKITNQTFCQIWYPRISHPVIVPLVVRKNGGGHKLNGTRYEQYYFTCSLHLGYPFPRHVSVTARPCEIPQSLVPVTVPILTIPEHEFGVCVPVAFGHVDPYRIIEWVEANRLLGVTQFNVYHVNLSNSTLNVLRHFSRKGLLNLYHIPSVPQYEPNRSGNKIGSPISLNDCMYRNMYKYKWILVIDFDELIVPRNHSGYAPMIKHIERTNRLARPAPGYTFRNTYFWSGCDNQTSEPSRAIMMRTFLHEAPSRNMFAPKSVINPRRCVSVFNHYCYHRFPMVDKTERWTIDVKVSVARSHHYRELYKKDRATKCKKLEKEGVRDDIMLRYKQQLQERYYQNLKELGLAIL